MGDLNGDGKGGHRLARNVRRGRIPGRSSCMWLMRRDEHRGATYLDPASSACSWHIQGTLDFNGDGRSDILWRNPERLGAADALRPLHLDDERPHLSSPARAIQNPQASNAWQVMNLSVVGAALYERWYQDVVSVQGIRWRAAMAGLACALCLATPAAARGRAGACSTSRGPTPRRARSSGRPAPLADPRMKRSGDILPGPEALRCRATSRGCRRHGLLRSRRRRERGRELWKSDGTPPAHYRDGEGSHRGPLTPHGSRTSRTRTVCCSSSWNCGAMDYPEVHHTQLWRSDGTAGGTMLLGCASPTQR